MPEKLKPRRKERKPECERVRSYGVFAKSHCLIFLSLAPGFSPVI
jgi:hypothetical protein